MKRLIPVLFLALIAPFGLRGQTPYLVKDINLTTAVGTGSSYPYAFFAYGSQVFFVADNFDGGNQLWATDGTAAGTAQLTGNGFVSLQTPPAFAVVNGKLVFNATDQHGEELWTTDGTKAGTRLLADINSGSASSSPHDRIVYHNKMIFSADDGVDGQELWITDGTPAGTMFFKDLLPGPDGSYPGSFVLLNDVIYFGAVGGLWKSDGTPGGTVEVVPQINPVTLTVAGSQIFFYGDNGNQTGYQPWVSDGTAAGTHPIGQFTSDPQGLSSTAFTAFGSRVLFVESDPQHGAEPWISDGTAAGTHILRDVNPGPAGSSVGTGGFTVAGNVAYFVAASTDGNSIWKTDGTEASTAEVPGASDTGASSLVAVGDKLYFLSLYGGSQYNGSVYTLWVIDGTASGPRLVKTTNPQFYVSEGTGLTNINGILYFAGANSLNGLEPWKSDGTDAGTTMIANLAPDETPSSAPNNLTAASDWVYFDAWDGFGTIQSNNGGPRSLWRSDGTSQGTLKLTDSPAGGYVAAGRSLFFNKNGAIWTTDGTPEGTVQANAFTSRFPSAPTLISSLGDRIFASVNGSLWATTSAATAPAVSLGVPAPYALIDIVGHEMFFANGGLWTTDGTPGGTYAVVPVIGENVTSGTAVMGGLLYFGTSGSGSGPKLWKSDGTFEGTVPVKVFPGGNVAGLVAAGGSLFFTVFNNAVIQLWVSDGTDAGTHVLPASPSSVLAATGSGVVFAANDSTNGYELWGSDGTTAGTHLVRDIFPGANSSSPSNLISVDGVVYFTAYDDVHSNELWVTDGTSAGTTLVADIEPGLGSSNPQQYVRAGGLLFFTATTTATGNELWALPQSAAPQLTINDLRLAEGDSGTTTARFTVTLAPAAAQTVTVSFATSDGSATAGSDYDARSGTLTFAPGETSKNIDVTVHGDTTPENNETFFVTLSNAAGATLTKPLGFAIIDDDDQYADLALALNFSSFDNHDVVAAVSNNGPRTATTLRVQSTATPVIGESNCVLCLPPPSQLAPGATAHVFDYQEVGPQQYLTATVTARQADPVTSNNRLGWITDGPLAMDALYLTPGSNATVWLGDFASLPAVSMESSNPAVLSVPASLTPPAGVRLASFVASGLSVGTATIRVFTPTSTIGTLNVDVVAPGTAPRWPGAVFAQPGYAASFDQPVDFTIHNIATAPYTGQTATGVVTISASGQELGRTTLPATGGARDVLVYLPVVGANAGTVDYAGDANFLPMSAPWTAVIPRGYVMIKSSADRNGTTATIHLRVNGSPVAAPTGTITVSEPGIIPATQATLTAVAGGGQADITLTNVTPGVHTLLVNYSGDTRYNIGTQNIRLLEEHRHVGPR